ncbi:MAG: Alpha/beta hydrolase fold protein [Rhizobium sp.]|nr:Alpha/beta hydrolase fold protein [Rhizobium sp.]
MPQGKPAFVFIHGAWHGARSWDKVMPTLEAAGHHCVALDLPGAGPNANSPASFTAKPFDPAAFGTEPSPNAGVTQEERTSAVISAVRAAATRGNGKVVLVGHSLGGITVSPVAEAVPELLHAVVYVTAFMLPPGMPAIAMIQHQSMAAALVPGLFMADPAGVGALRINVASDDLGYSAGLKAAFSADVDEAEYETFRKSLHCDEPAQVALVPSAVTAGAFGSVPRHYIHCDVDRAITPAGQALMVEMVDAALGGKTVTHRLSASHSPFLSQPGQLAEILLASAG